jgi:transcriptional regulator with XRE-family HTH domain
MSDVSALAERLAPALSGKTVHARLAHVLVELGTRLNTVEGSGPPVLVPMTQPELAELVGAGEPAVHKALRGFREAGLVETGYRQLTIHDLDALDEIARGRSEETSAAGIVGSSGERAARRIGELRRSLGLTLADLERRLGELGRPIPVSSLSKIENGQRRVDVDDLLALALALDASPNAILLPGADDLGDDVALAPGHVMDGASAWRWASKDVPVARPLPLPASDPDSYRWDFFISYDSPDASWAEWIAWSLEDAGFRTFVMARDVVVGQNWSEALDEGLTGARRVVAVLSNSYLRSKRVSNEWRTAYQADPEGLDRRLIPVRIEPCEPSGVLRNVASIDLFGLTEQDSRARLVRHICASIEGKGQLNPVFPGRRTSDFVAIDVGTSNSSVTIMNFAGGSTEREAEASVEALVRLAPHLPPESLDSALNAALALEPSGRARALAGLAPYLSPDLLALALTGATALEEPAARVEALAGLIPHLPASSREDAAVTALASAASVEASGDRALALASLLTCLPDADRRMALIEAALAAVGSGTVRPSTNDHTGLPEIPNPGSSE